MTKNVQGESERIQLKLRKRKRNFTFIYIHKQNGLTEQMITKWILDW